MKARWRYKNLFISNSNILIFDLKKAQKGKKVNFAMVWQNRM